MPAGVSGGTIEDSAITASSFMDSSSKPSAGRLNSSNGAWCAKVNDKHQYLQIDLGNSEVKYVSFCFTGLKITAGHRTMSGQDDYLSGQNLGLAVILTGQVRSFQIIH